MADLGAAGRLADSLLDSPLVPLLVVASLTLGVWGLMVTPREDRPDIDIPRAAISVAYPGAGAERVDELVARRISSLVRQLPDVVDVRSAASEDAALVSVEFEAGLTDAEAHTQLTELLARNAQMFPPGAMTPMVETFGEERLTVLMATLSGADPDARTMREVAEELAARLETVEGVRSVDLHGGSPRALQILPDPARLAAHGLSLSALARAVRGTAVRLPADALYGREVRAVYAGLAIESADDLRRTAVGSTPAGIVYLEDVARVIDAPLAREQAVLHWPGHGRERSAITLAVASVPERNVSAVTRRVREEIARLSPRLIPPDLELSIGYDAGREAAGRVRSVLRQLLTGTLIVVGIIWLGLGWRAALVIAVMMPASLAIVPYAYFRLGYTLNPVSIAAMILAIGILADDAIIMLENIARLYRVHGRASRELTVRAVNEVGNPTILADLLVVATLLPTAYITGEMGQYVRAIPIGASAAVLFSLLIALSITPWTPSNRSRRLPRLPSRFVSTAIWLRPAA